MSVSLPFPIAFPYYLLGTARCDGAEEDSRGALLVAELDGQTAIPAAIPVYGSQEDVSCELDAEWLVPENPLRVKIFGS